MTTTTVLAQNTASAATASNEERMGRIASIIFLTGLGPCFASMATLTPEATSLVAGAVLGAAVATRVRIAGRCLAARAFSGGLAGLLIGGGPYAIANQRLFNERLPESAVSDFVLTTCPLELTSGRTWLAVPERSDAAKNFTLTVKKLSTQVGRTTVTIGVDARYKSLVTGMPTVDALTAIDVALPPKYDGSRPSCAPAMPRASNGFIFKPA